MRIFNKRARYLYQIQEAEIEAGLVLTGAEAKSLREGRGDLSQAHIRLIADGLYLINANVPTNNPQNPPTRMRKLLLNKHEIVSLTTKMKQQKLILVPLAVYNRGRLFKLEVGLGKPKRKFEKREYLKEKDLKRDIQKELKLR